MTKEEAIKMLKSKMDGHTDISYEWAETVRMAIKALEQEQNGDAISRQAVLKQLRGCLTSGETEYQYVKLHIDSIPSVKPQEPKTGHWIDRDEKSAVCSCCNRNNTLYGDFCKWCGARMVEPQERSEKE